MSNLPMRDKQFRTADFLAWLASNGAEVGGPTNPYELVRYKAYTSDATRALTHIVYRKDNGLLTWTGASMKHYQAFLDGAEFVWSKPYRKPVLQAIREGEPPVTHAIEGATNISAKLRRKVMERDGSDCWFCGLPMGSDCTLEHLVPQSRGGGNGLANLALAHAKCNREAADLSITEKVELRARKRGVSA